MKKLISFVQILCLLLSSLAMAEPLATPTDLECDHPNIIHDVKEYVEATETVPGHWEIPFMGNGRYLPVLPKAK